MKTRALLLRQPCPRFTRLVAAAGTVAAVGPLLATVIATRPRTIRSVFALLLAALDAIGPFPLALLGFPALDLATLRVLPRVLAVATVTATLLLLLGTALVAVPLHTFAPLGPALDAALPIPARPFSLPALGPLASLRARTAPLLHAGAAGSALGSGTLAAVLPASFSPASFGPASFGPTPFGTVALPLSQSHRGGAKQRHGRGWD